MDWSSLSEKYWHCYVSLKRGKFSIINDLTIEQIRSQIVDPWRKGTRFIVGTLVVPDPSEVDNVKIVLTDYPLIKYVNDYNAEIENLDDLERLTINPFEDKRQFPFPHGKDFTSEFLFQGSFPLPSPNFQSLLSICERFHYAYRSLSSPARGNPYSIENEYDAQNLLRAILKTFIPYTIPEEPVGRVAGGSSSTVDFAIEELGTLIEVKIVRNPRDQERLISEFADDIVKYSKWAPLVHLIYLVVYSHILVDPESLQKLGGKRSHDGREFQTHVVLV